MKRSMYRRTLMVGLALTFSCSENSDPLYDQQNFTTIYDNNEFSATYYPIDIKQTADLGFLILSERKLTNSNFRGITVMKVDKVGKFVSEVELDDQFVNPVAELMPSGDRFYFFCMSAANLQAQIAEVEPDSAKITLSQPGGGFTYPAAASKDSDGFLLLSYDHIDKQSVISKHSTAGVSFQEFSIGIGEDVEEPIINHFLRTGKRFPFQVGRVPGGSYFFNGFENYTFSLVFTDLAGTGADGVVQGQQDDGGFSSVLPLGGAKFAASRFNFGDNYLLPNVNITSSATASSVDLGGNTFPELVGNAPVKIIRAQIDNNNVLIFASDTRSKQVGLFFYEEATGKFLSSRYLGFSNPFEIANLVQTSDQGLAVCGTTYLAGRFPRVFLIKMSKAELLSQIK